nr:cobalamin adenosyltransferase [uncultured Oscillibacter sp.]
MQVLQEDTVRQLHLKQGKTEIHVGPKTYVTQQARDYIKEKRLTLIVDGETPENRDIRPAPEMAAGRFRTESGQVLDHKPEHMTHLHGNVLVPKTHPRIVLRGQLDSLEAEIVCLQVRTQRAGEEALTNQLTEVLGFCRGLMGSEVTGTPLKDWKLLGLDSQGLREQSQQPQKYFGIGHLMPDYRLGEWGAELNRLRAMSRQVELAAADAFIRPDGTAEREDLLQGYNRLSSAFYVLMLQLASSGKEGEKQTHE